MRCSGSDEDVERWSTYVGRGAIRFYLPLDVQLANDFFAQAVIVAKDVDARERLQARLEQLLAEEFPGVVSRISPLELGPPVGWPVQYRVSGPDMDQVREIAFELAQVMATEPEARRINFDWNEPARQLRIQVNQDEARRLGLSSAVAGGRAERRRHGLDRDPDARRHLPDRRRRPGDGRGTHVAPDAAHPAGPAAQRAHGRARPVRHLRIRAGVSPGLAPRPGADAHGARRRRAGRPAGDASSTELAPGDRRAERRPAGGLSDRRSAASPRRARSRRPRSSPCCR